MRGESFTSSSRAVVAGTIAAMVLLVGFVFGGVRTSPFIPFDDNRYVYENPVVLRGLTAEGTGWAFRTTHASNWHPVTWLSHMADVELFGVNPGAHHLVNVAIHLLNGILLYLWLLRWTGAPWRSAAAAAIFLVHPLHVESVAWISERKDVLSAMFLLLALHAHGMYASRPSVARYACTGALLSLGLMAKPMLVTAPFLLLLADVWPLGRAGRCPPRETHVPGGHSPGRLFLEKVPLLGLAAASCWITYFAQKEGGALGSLPAGYRVANAVVSYGRYVADAFSPTRLAMFYPHPVGRIPSWKVALSAVFLAGVTALVVRQWRRRPWLPVGWFWFLGTLVPVIGIVQVGSQAMADRYMYIPLIGLSLSVVWGVADLRPASKRFRSAFAVAAAALLLVLAVLARQQAGYWSSAVSLLNRAREVTDRNYIAENLLGVAQEELGNLAAAEAGYRAALGYQPMYAEAHNNLGIVLSRQGRQEEAIAHFERAIRLRPAVPDPYNNLGLVLARQGRIAEGAEYFRKALAADPDHEKANANLGVALSLTGDFRGAYPHLEKALRINPANVDAARALDGIRSGRGRY